MTESQSIRIAVGKDMERQREIRMYGCTETDIREQYMNSITAKLSGLEMVAMSVLSDAQELMAMGQTEAARKNINIAKFILSEMMDARVPA
jgi:hypothetical protein